MSTRFLRFVAPERDMRTGQPTGLLTLAYAVLRSDDIGTAEASELAAHVEWIERNLPVPTRFARKRNVSHKQTHGLAWIRTDATDVIERLRAIAEILGRQGHAVEIVLSDRPGYIVYEDDLQVVAEPFHGEAV